MEEEKSLNFNKFTKQFIITNLAWKTVCYKKKRLQFT